jgi:hypothetical protein
MFLEIKLRRRDFLYWGLFDPKPLTEGPEPTCQTMLDQVNLASGWSWPAWEPAGSLRRRWRLEGGGEKGPAGPESHQGVAGDVGPARGGPPAAQSKAAASGTCRGTAKGGGDPGGRLGRSCEEEKQRERAR